MTNRLLWRKTRAYFAAVFVFGLIVGVVAFGDLSAFTRPQDESAVSANKDNDPPKQDARMAVKEPEDSGAAAERDTARYTLWLAVGTFVLAIGSLFQIYFLRRTDEAAGKAANAAEKAAVAAIKSNEHSEKALIASQRPWVVCEAVSVREFRRLDNGEYIIFAKVFLRNTGISLAKNVHVVMQMGEFAILNRKQEWKFIDHTLENTKSMNDAEGWPVGLVLAPAKHPTGFSVSALERLCLVWPRLKQVISRFLGCSNMLTRSISLTELGLHLFLRSSVMGPVGTKTLFPCTRFCRKQLRTATTQKRRITCQNLEPIHER